MWIAKNKDTGFEYPKRFDDIYECQDYIDNELKDDLKKANEDYVNNMRKKGKIVLWHCNRILCWHNEQKRFADGFDF